MMGRQRPIERRQWIWTAILILYILFIFSNSLTPGDESSSQSGFVLELAKRCLAAVGLGNVGITEHFIRKLAHFSEYFILGALIIHVVKGFYHGAPGLSWAPVWLLAGVLVPLCDETCQLFTDGRSGQISDVWLDISGMICGSLIFLLISRWFGDGKRKGRRGRR